MSAKFIVFEGSDGTGKTTQAKLLRDFLAKKGIDSVIIDFPRYWSSFHGRIIRRYLHGELGKLDHVNPYLISFAYSLDRATAKEEIQGWLNEGKFVIADRYAPSNMAYQAAKLPPSKRNQFIKWDYDLEYKENKIVPEDFVLYLYLPIDITTKLLKKRNRKLDIHEVNVDLLRESQKMYLKLSKRFKHWVVINCVDEQGNLKSREEIHEKIVATLKKLNII
ncbi:MAG: dTMP kinase [bacterium]|nr:dTMP kinase [bacterium]